MRSILAKLIALVLLIAASYVMYNVGEPTIQYALGASFALYYIVLFLYSKMKGLNTLDLFDEIDTEEEIGEYEDITLKDVINYWHADQQKGIKGLFRSIPDIDDINDPKKSDIVEVELDVEHLVVSTSLMHVGWNAVSGIKFYTSPYPVTAPTTFVDETQVFPMEGTLKKITCSSCSGSGQIRCYSCSGSGNTRCTGCGGSGSVTTTEYTGYGSDRKSQQVRKSCMSCGGRGTRSCSSCGGTGRRTCSTCAGSGALGQYHATIFNFNHWQNQRVFKIADGNQIVATDVFDIQNEHGQLLPAFTNGTYQPVKMYGTVKGFDEKVEESIKELQVSAKMLQNELFHNYTMRRIPELEFQVKAGNNELNLTARGFRPYRGQQSELDDFPISKFRIFLGGLFYVFYAGINYVLLEYGLDRILSYISNMIDNL